MRVINGPIRQLCNIEVPRKIEAWVQPLGIGFAEMPLLWLSNYGLFA